MMTIVLDERDLRPLIERVVVATLDHVDATRQKLDGRLAYTEPEAAALLGVQRHALRDCRLRGEITGSVVGKRVVYAVEELRDFLRRRQVGNI
jgi:hypothetical protein